MNSKDPFTSSDRDDRTIIRPTPGGRRADLNRSASRPGNYASAAGSLPQLGGLNTLEQAASGLLALLTRLNSTRSHPDPERLKDQITGEINLFHQTAQAKDIDPETVHTASYVLCTALDEAVLNTPWGNNSGWAQNSLLSSFHKEVSGGERFFQMLKSLGQNSARNLYLLELMYLCLALGFEGRYRIVAGGKDRLVQIRQWLYQLIRRERDGAEKQLSPHWQGVTDRRNPLARYVPLWVIAAVALGLSAVLYSALLMNLNHESDPVFKQIFAIKPVVAKPPVRVEPEPAPVIRVVPELTLSKLLADEIAQGKVVVDEQAGQSKVIIQGDGLFRSGRSEVKQSVIPLLQRIAEALDQLRGQVLITGHTDSIPIRNSRYPSNWHLSKDRATAVADIMRQYIDAAERISVEGRADLEPIASNETSQGRAKNRRVEILLIK